MYSHAFLFAQSKNSRPLRTCQIYMQDDNATQIQLYNNRFELMKIIASKRSPPIKPLYVQETSLRDVKIKMHLLYSSTSTEQKSTLFVLSPGWAWIHSRRTPSTPLCWLRGIDLHVIINILFYSSLVDLERITYGWFCNSRVINA